MTTSPEDNNEGYAIQLPIVTCSNQQSQGETLFPEELWHMNAACADQRTLKSLRLCCKKLAPISATHLFRTIRIRCAARGNRIRHVAGVSNNSDHVQCLLLHRNVFVQHLGDAAGNVHNTIVNLTDVRCKLNIRNDRTVRSLSGFLSSVKKVEVLFIGVDDESRHDILLPFRHMRSGLKNLRSVILAADMSGASLLAFFSEIALSLRELAPLKCKLSDSENTWPNILEQARQLLSLDRVELVHLRGYHHEAT